MKAGWVRLCYQFGKSERGRGDDDDAGGGEVRHFKREQISEAEWQRSWPGVSAVWSPLIMSSLWLFVIYWRSVCFHLLLFNRRIRKLHHLTNMMCVRVCVSVIATHMQWCWKKLSVVGEALNSFKMCVFSRAGCTQNLWIFILLVCFRCSVQSFCSF